MFPLNQAIKPLTNRRVRLAAALAPVAGMALWIKADAGVLDASNNPCTDGVKCKTWNDSSPNGNNFTQATTALQPTFKTGIKNGNPVLRFPWDGVNSIGMTNSAAASLNFDQPISLYMVIQQFTGGEAGAGRPIMRNIGANGPFQILGAGAGNQNLLWDNGSQASFARAFNTWLLYSIIHNSGTATIYSAGTQIATGSAGAGVTTSAGWRIGDRGGFRCMDGDIGEILVYNANHSTGDRQTVQNYLNAKWGIF